MAGAGVHVLHLEYRPVQTRTRDLQQIHFAFVSVEGSNLSFRADGYPARLLINQVAQLLTAP